MQIQFNLGKHRLYNQHGEPYASSYVRSRVCCLMWGYIGSVASSVLLPRYKCGIDAIVL